MHVPAKTVATVIASAAVTFATTITSVASVIEAPFTLLQDPQRAGIKPGPDWLVGTANDQTLDAAFNPLGAFSHNFVSMAGNPGPGHDLAPSLTGDLTLRFAPAAQPVDGWQVEVTDLAFAGQATPIMSMNQLLVTPSSPAALDPVFHVDGLGNAGSWAGSAAGGWAISYTLDFYLDTNASLDPINATFNDSLHSGYLIPVEALTDEGLAALGLVDPAGFYSAALSDYLLDAVAPLLPDDATFLLFTQMDKTHPAYTELGLPITTDSLIGNTTIAYTTAIIPEPATLVLLIAGAAGCLLRRRAADAG